VDAGSTAGRRRLDRKQAWLTPPFVDDHGRVRD
jgi:hypothetical protein